MSRGFGYQCTGCKKFVWTNVRTNTCPYCGVCDAPKVHGRAPGIKCDLPAGVHNVGPRAQYVRSRYHLKEIFKSESDRMKRDIRFVEGD
jgi:hypothetical protein